MTRIRSLDDRTVAQIAAGEVVTDPAAVVRELLDNSLDAGADRIEVAVRRGGIDRVRVRDDGHGIPADQVSRAFERHATSKIRGAEDLRTVDSLGFRGEALAAIAEAATVSLTTRAPDDRAVRATPEGTEPAARGVGTTVVVEDLFAERPARRSSLSAPDREFAAISALVGRYALLWPGVRFTLEHDGDRVFATPGSGDRVDALLGVYDREVARDAREFADRQGPVAVEGVACRPSVTRSRRRHVHVGVGGRPVDAADVRRAVRSGYGSLPPDRYPVAVVDVSLPPERVDVNVHPGKREVALADADRVADAVRAAVGEALSTDDLSRVADSLGEGPAPLDRAEAEALADLSVLGVFRDLYLLCSDGDRLLVVDGHAAHERVTYERLRAGLDDRLDRRPLDPPETVALDPPAAALVGDDTVRSALDRVGYDVEPLGGTTVRVRTVPAPADAPADPHTLEGMLETVADGDDPVEVLREEALADLACHRSLRAGDDFDGDTARRLVAALADCDRPYACPHGRPTVLAVEEADLVRGFDRENSRLE